MQFYFKIEPTMKRSSLTISLKLKLYTEKMKRKCYFPEEEGGKINYIFIPCALTWRGKRVMVEQWGHLEPGHKYPFPPENMVTRHQTENSFLPQPQTAHKLYKSWQIHNPVNKPLDLINFLIKATKQLRKATKNVVSRNSYSRTYGMFLIKATWGQQTPLCTVNLMQF